MPIVEIYTKTFCPYCWRAKHLLDSKGVEYHEIAVDFGGAERAADDPARATAGRPSRRSSSASHVGGCDDLVRARARGQARRAARALMTRIALFQSNTGIDPEANARALGRGDRRGRGGRRGNAVHARNVGPARPRFRARARRTCAARSDDLVLAACREAAREHGIWVHLGSLAVLADDGKVANRGFVIDRDGRDPRALRQDPFVRRRPADRRELARIRGLSRRARARSSSTARRSASSA